MNTQIEIRHVESIDDARALSNFFNEIWVDGDDVVPLDIILAAVHVSAYAVLGIQNDRVVAGSFGFFGKHNGANVLHSHATAATVPGVGWLLKQHQREWAKRLDLDAITWTFDPLVRRNCVFNFEKLGATAIEYVPNFYGSMNDSINLGEESDRFFVFWDIKGSQSAPVPAGEFATLVRNDGGIPALQPLSFEAPFWIELPQDIESLRHVNALQARQWRSAVREYLLPAFQNGWTVGHMSASREAILVQPAKQK